jgi:hypothetical protein
MIHGDQNYPISNTTPDLLKFQLQQQYWDKLKQLKQNHSDELSLLNTHLMDSSFDSHLQSKLDTRSVQINQNNQLLSPARTPTATQPTSPGTDSVSSLEADFDFGSESDLDSFISKSSAGSNYLNLRILIENSVFDLAKINKHSIISLPSLNTLKSSIKLHGETQQYLNSKLSLSQQLLTDAGDLDHELQIKLYKSFIQLSSQLNKVSQELAEMTTKLNNHNLACLVLGYVEDVRVSSSKSTSNPTQESLDPLFSKIVNIAVKRNVTLPEPDENDKVSWAETCIEKLVQELPHTKDDVDEQRNSVQTTPSSISSQKSLQTALNDLQFSHQYLIKEYEHSRENSQKLINEYRKTIALLESRTNEPTATAIDYECYNRDSITNKDKEIAKLRKELNLMKIDKLGTNVRSSPLRFENNGSNFNLETPPNTESGDDDETGSIMSGFSSTRPSTNGTSNGILRKEFKKIVNDIQDQYEVELEEERLRRRQLQDELDEIRLAK